MGEKRKTQRRRVLKEGKIIFADGMRVIDCTIRDMSDSGARLLIANRRGAGDVPSVREIEWHGLSDKRRLAPRQCHRGQIRRAGDEHSRQRQPALRPPALPLTIA
jgi:hypothetical protein